MTTPKPRRMLVALALATSLTTAGCMQLFYGGIYAVQSMLPVSDEAEVQMGQASVRSLLANPQVRLYPDPTVALYVSRVGMEMAQQTGRARLPWQFAVLDNPEPNAFALPGGYVFITTGALRSMTNEAELAGVLGHEAGHVAARHGVEQMKRALLAKGLLVSTLGTSPEAAQVVGSIGAELVLRGYGRDAELEADRLGARYASRAGYDPHALEAFLRTLAARGETPGWLAPLETHPPIAERLAKLQADIQRERLGGTRLGAETFQAAMSPLLGGGAGH